MTSADEAVEEPFKLNMQALQGRWMCEELGAALTVSGQTVQYVSGECYPVEVTPEGKLEIFGYRAVGKKSDASSIVWKNKETGKYLTWMYEGDDAGDEEPEVDKSLIIEGSGGRSSRKRKVDYAALDKELDQEKAGGVGKQNVWESQYAALKTGSSTSPKGPTEEAVEASFKGLKRKLQTWILSTDQERLKSILAKRGYLSTEISYGTQPADLEASRRLVTYIKSIGAKGMMSQSGNRINVRISDSSWSSVIGECRGHKSSDSSSSTALIEEVEAIRDDIAKLCEKEELRSEPAMQKIEATLDRLESLPIDLDVLKLTKIGVEINKLSKICEKAKKTLVYLKSIYLQSKKAD